MNQIQISNHSLVETQTVGADLMHRWIEYVDAKPKTIETYNRAIRQFFTWMCQEGISRPTREDIISYREAMASTRKPATVQAYIQAVKLFFSWAEMEGLYPNVAKHVKGAKLDTGKAFKKDYLTSGQAKDVLGGIDRSTVQGKRDYAIVSLMMTAGLRTIEVSRANLEDMRPVGDCLGLYVQGKGHEDRNAYVKLAPPVEAAIRDYLAARGKTDPKHPLFASLANRNDGERMTTRSISRIAKSSMQAVGLDSDRLTAHSFRHTAATLNLLNGASLEETKQLLRHSKLDTTMIYSHALDRAKNNSEMRVATAIFS